MNLKEYFARVGSRFSDADAQIIGPEIDRLALQSKSAATDILDSARVESSPLHGYFEWDNAVAAEEYRLDQARAMARCYVVKTVDMRPDAKPVRGTFAVRPMTVNREGQQVPRSGASVYMTVEQVQRNHYLAAQVLAKAKADLISWARRYQEVRVLFEGNANPLQPVFDFVDTLEAEDKAV